MKLCTLLSSSKPADSFLVQMWITRDWLLPNFMTIILQVNMPTETCMPTLHTARKLLSMGSLGQLLWVVLSTTSPCRYQPFSPRFHRMLQTLENFYTITCFNGSGRALFPLSHGKFPQEFFLPEAQTLWRSSPRLLVAFYTNAAPAFIW